MRGIQGAMIVASTLQIVIGFSGLWRNVTRWHASCVYVSVQWSCLWHKVSNVVQYFRLMSPLSTVPLVALTGFGLYELGFPLVTFMWRMQASFQRFCFLSYMISNLICDSSLQNVWRLDCLSLFCLWYFHRWESDQIHIARIFSL